MRPPFDFITRRLSRRIVALFLVLLLVVQAAGFGVIGNSIEGNARKTLARELKVGESLWRSLLEQKANGLVQGTRVLAADYGFREAVATGDAATLGSALENHASRIDATLSAWVDLQLELRAASDATGAAADSTALRHVARELTSGDRGSGVLQYAGQPTQFVAVPVKAPQLIGWVVLGFPIDQALVDEMRRLSDLDVALLSTDAAGGTRVGVSTLGAAAPDAARAEGDRAVVGGDEKQIRRLVLSADGGSAVVLLRSVAEAVEPYRALQWLLLGITLAGVAVFFLGSLFTARLVTTPLRSLVGASERLGRGDYTQPLAHTERGDEIGDLAKAFDHMRVNIAANEAEIRQLAYWDRLTGLPNRAQFRDAVQSAIATAREHGGALSVLMLNLDRFKHINDKLGYAAGDAVLQAVAERLKAQVVREGDLVARLTGDKFALLLPGVEADRALGIATLIGAALNLPLKLAEQTVDAPASFGIAGWPAHAADADTLLNRAEVAMYATKHKTTRALVYDPKLDAGSVQNLSLLSELRHALERDELRLFLQPKIALADGALVSAEALVRWQHPRRGMVPPMEFIPFAEDTGFVCQLTLWMFEACARQWPALQALGLRRVSVNLSARDLMDHDLPAKLDQLLSRHDVPATAFCLEITESALMEDPQRALATLNALHAAGFKLSIDDFGTGYSSLEYLKRMPLDELKIDKTFVMAMETNQRDAMIVRSTIDLAHNLGLTVVAEGVENAAILAQLRALDCDETQGYHMSKPVPAGDFEAFALRWQARARDASDTRSAALH